LVDRRVYYRYGAGLFGKGLYRIAGEVTLSAVMGPCQWLLWVYFVEKRAG
jgi:hypothetical protein